VLLIGPEGGFSGDELKKASTAAYQIINIESCNIKNQNSRIGCYQCLSDVVGQFSWV
jgi:hypothetical protein